ncbi:fatty acid efflux MMPL transporter FarE [Barrientosiimonas marina]|uniref:MMPL family transporter n=1 Tax=Lentibacillus kimchii TaxID=1542911 RepID=A0ABW2UVY5_9BACI
MANFLYKVGSFFAKHKWWSVLIWLVLLIAIITPLTTNAPKFDSDIKMNGLKSIDTNEKIGDEFNQDSEKAKIRIVFKSNTDNGITEEDTKNDIQDTLTDIKRNDDYVASVTDPYEAKRINDDGTTAFADVNYVTAQTSLKEASKTNVEHELDDLKEDHMLQTELTGSGMEDLEFGGLPEVVGIVIAFIVLLVTFGSLIVAGMPILSALLGLGSSVGIIALLTFAFDIPNVTLTLAIMIGLAVGIDYALFILFRYRQIAKTERDHVKAIGLAVGTAGSAVIFAGITVIIAVCGLSLVGIDFLAVMGFSSAISVFIAVLSALTLLPAFISIFHKRVQPKANKTETKDHVETPWSKFVVGKPALAVFLVLVVLGLAIIPMSHMRLGLPDDGMKPNDSTQHKAYEIISEDFGEGYNGQIAMLVNTKDKQDGDALNQDLQNMTDDIADMDNVDTVAPAQLTPANDYALVGIIPDDGPNSESTNNLVHDLRDYSDQAKDLYNFDTEISGQSVINIDMSEKLNDAIPVFAGVIVALAFVLLMLVFRSIIVPLKAVLGFVLSLAATLGFTTLVMQDGFISGLFGVDTPGPLLAFLPVIVIGLLFGLAIDYELFLMTRIHEEYSKTHDNEHSIKVGIKESGPVIVAAALIMFSVFIAFVFQDDVIIKSLGIALAFGVLFDAFIVRLTLIPALTKLFGNASWYLPKWLNRVLPKIDIEGYALEEKMHSDQTLSAGYQSSADSEDEQMAPLSDIEMDNQTEHLYHDLLEVSPDRSTLFNGVLFNALMEYARENHREIYDKYTSKMTDEEISNQQELMKNVHSSEPAKELEGKLSDDEILKLLNQQNQNVEKINDIISKLVDKGNENNEDNKNND